jgi:hypothetical protein
MSGNYQSRVFTFINSRTNQLKDTCEKGLRHLKVAVVWTGQILLYPLQLLAQTTKIFQTQLPSPPSPRSLIQPAADINIEQALDLVAGAGYPIVISDRGTLAADVVGEDYQLQQFAPSRAISKFDDQNSWNLEHYDPDTEDWEVSSYSPKSRRVTARKPIVRGLSSLLSDRQLVLVTTENEILDILTVSQQQEIRRRIGIDLAIYWHQWHTVKLSDSQSTQQLASADRELLLTDRLSIEQLTIGGNTADLAPPPLLDRLQHWLGKLTAKFQPPAIPNIAPTVPRQLPAASYPFTPQPPQFDRFLDLPQLPPLNESHPWNLEETQILSHPDHRIRNTIAKLQPDWLKQWWNYYREYLYIPAKNAGQIVKQPAEFRLVPLDSGTEKIRSKQASKQQSLIDQSSSELVAKRIDWDLEHHPDWIEAESETIGYNQSPIAQFLAWLDRLFLKLENWLIKIWLIIINDPAQS